MLLKKCDEATQSIEVPSPDSIDSEVKMYFNQQDEDWSPMLSDNDETNELVQTIQFLKVPAKSRIHLSLNRTLTDDASADIIAPESFRHRVQTALPDVFVDV